MSRCCNSLLAIIVTLVATDLATAQSLLDRLSGAVNPAEQPAADANRTPQRASGPGYLGLMGDEIEGESGVFIAEVEEGSPAARAGLQPGDQIVKMGGADIRTLDDMAGLLRRHRAGQRIEFVVIREGRQHRIAATLAAARPAVTTVERATDDELPPADVPATDERSPVLGVTAAPVTDALRERYGFTNERGAVIAGIDPGSPAHRQRLPIGGVIVDVNGQEIHAPEDLQEIVAASQAGDDLELIYYIGEQRYRTKLRLAPAAAQPPTAALRPEPNPGQPARRGTDLEDRLGEGGRRPLLGRIGRVIDDIVDEEPPADPEATTTAPEDVVGPEPANDDEQLLREELELLRREVSILRRRVDELERRLRAD